MQYLGELISLTVAISWTATAMLASEATQRIGTLPANIIRMAIALILFGITLVIATGTPVPQYTDGQVWLWLSLSGLVGYVFGDYCLFSSYLHIGSRYGQLFMTLSPPTAALLGWLFLNESLGIKAMFAMAVTLVGIAMTILTTGDDGKFHSKLPLKGILFGIGAGVGQGGGLVLSKVGLLHYNAAIPADAPAAVMNLVPFSSTMIRGVTGIIGFTILLFLMGESKKFVTALHDRKALAFTGLGSIFGPFIGVSLSLMAVEYTSAGIASTIMALTPALIIIPHWLIYHKRFSFKEILGTIISLVGVGMFFL